MKKAISLFLLLTLLAGCFALHANAAGMLGDVDGDGVYTSGDARTILRAAVGLDALSPDQKTAADVDHDGNITAADARTVLRAAVNLDELNAAGTAFVAVVPASEKIKSFIIANQTYYQNGIYAYGYSDDDFEYAFMYDTRSGETYRLGAEAYYTYGAYEYLVSVWMNDSFTDYIAQLEVYENGNDYGYAVYKLNQKTFSHDNALNALTETDYYGLDGATKAQVKNLVAEMAALSLYNFVADITDANIGVDYKKDMHLEQIVL